AASTLPQAAVEFAEVVLESLAIEANEPSREDLVALKRHEDGVPREDGVGKQENRSHYPNRIGTQAHARRTRFTNQVSDLWEIRNDHQGCADVPKPVDRHR